MSVKVKPAGIEKIFSNGYHLAEILCRAEAARNIGILHHEDLALFRNSRHRNAAIENFTLLQPLFKKVGLVVPVDQVRRIVIEERGAASDLLFKLRSAFKSKDGKVPKVQFRKFDESVFNYNRDKKPLLPQIRKSTVLHDTIIDSKSSKQNRDSAIHLRHFEEKQNEWQKKVAYMEVDEIKALEKKNQLKRMVEKETLVEKRKWTVNREKEEVERWQKTQGVKVLRQRKQLEFELSVLEKQRRKNKLRRKRMGIDQKRGIEAFDRNRKRLGVGGDEEEELPEDPEVLKIERVTPIEHLQRLKKIVAVESKTLAAPARNYMKKLHVKRVTDNIARKEREARQRKQDVDQRKAQVNAEQSKQEKKILQKLISSAQAERAEGHKRWVAKHTGIRDMKRKAKILEMKRGEYTSEIATYFDNFFETAKAVVAARQPQEAAERERLRIAREARQAMKLKEHTGWINSFVKQLVGVTLIVVEEHERNASLGREPVIGAKKWRILRTDFVRGRISADALMGVSESMLGGMDITSEHQLDLADYSDYMSNARSWSPSTELAGIAGDSASGLGPFERALKSLSGSPPLPEQVSKLGPSVIGISVIGGPLLGKSIVSDTIAQRYRMQVVSASRTIQAALDFGKSDAEPQTPVEEAFKKLSEEITGMEEDEEQTLFGVRCA